MKLTDYIANFFSDHGVDTAFGLTGGAVVHIFDSLDKHPKIRPIFCHHEQAASLAAPAYSKIKQKPGLCIVTTGPGGTNALTGLTGAWQESIPCFFISGQSRMEHTSRGKPVRQIGSQELDIISIVDSITNYAALIESPERIKYHLEKAFFYATRKGRPGPVWLDIPLDFQWAEINPSTLKGYNKYKEQKKTKAYKNNINRFKKMIIKAERPLILLGQGVRLAYAEKDFKKVLEKWSIPFISTWGASDIIPTNHCLYVGRPGVAGQRGANLAMQNCDLLIAIGSHLSVALTGTLFHYFARDAKRVIVNIDQNELNNETVKVDLAIKSDAKEFLKDISSLNLNSTPKIDYWKKKCVIYNSYNKVLPKDIKSSELVSPYTFLDRLNKKTSKDDIIVVDGGGTVVYTSFQSLEFRGNQRVLYSSGIGAMGSGLPESIGACLANGLNRIICLCGDGSMQLNVQELETIIHNNLPVKIFLFNNSGYLSIRGTQEGFLNANYVGSAKEGGMSLPDFKKIAKAYGYPIFQINNNGSLDRGMQNALSQDGPTFCEVLMPPDQEIIPTQGFKENTDGTFSPAPLEDMKPFLDRKEFNELMEIKPVNTNF